MAVVDVDPDELRRFTGHDEKSDGELRADLFELGLEYEGETDEGLMQLEFEADRLDRLSVEGIARSLRYQYGDDRGVYVPRINDADWTIEVDPSTPDERPYVTGAVIRGLDLDEAGLDSLIQLQEKLHATMGRGRAKGAIGIHDLTMVKGQSRADDADNSITYRGIEPDEDSFVPLDSHAELTPAEVLTEHPTGETYADLIAEYERYPAIYDDLGLFSFPPVINGRRTEVNTESRELFVELTGTDQWTIDRMCAIICYALDARGATVERVNVEYPDRTLNRPDFALSEKTVAHERIERSLGVSLDEREVVDLLERSGLDAETSDNGSGDGENDADRVYDVSIPPYRVDVLHPVDVIDDIGRAYGFNELEPEYPDVSTVGGRHERSRHERAIRDTLVGLGFEDLLDFHLIGETENFDRMGLSPDDEAFGAAEPTTIAEPYSQEYGMVRTWALPSLVMVLENNTHRRYPQDLAEVGLAAHVDDTENTNVTEERHVAGVLARTDASYEDAKGRVSALARAFDVSLETSPTEHASFIDGRAASVVLDGKQVGIVGELHPEVLVEHGLELPVAAFEFRADALR
ncbi:phenylalanine--tRNA ligase subunit beta [Halococcus saccharolyticus]|uniref:Phenylalanine--tRNA ligase beta subunit n=1 Tax=Halococcus saccharolyticus DSM 5350 TaxID=1227455 RepID=M0MFH6_9EURY|nr:phenylalanine--tRNA ligase subunit beta [Halococcus saccharolyticus]EMA43175.1 phenylalanyl-tRNA ligase subunit beta [Halococcus saccharolyticus DSM 5350]